MITGWIFHGEERYSTVGFSNKPINLTIMVILKILDIVLAAGAVQGFFLALILTAKSTRKKTSSKLLAALLIVLSVSILHSLLAGSGFDSPYKIREPFILFIGPLLNFYVYELTGSRKIAWNDILHFLPFVLLILFLMPAWAGIPSPYTTFLFQNGPTISRIIWTLIVLQYGYYWWNTISVLHEHRIAVESEFSNIEGKTLSWLVFFLHLFGGFLLVLVLTLVIAFHSDRYDLIDIIVCLGLSCTIFILGYNGLFQEEVFSITTSQNGTDKREKDRQPRPPKTDVQPSTRNDESLQRLKAHLEKTKPYLNETLTLTELAGQVGITRNQLSFLINSAYGENFYSFINRYRVEEVKRLIADPKKLNFTILSLAYEAGFPSKSSFHSVFKKLTGLTPTEYRKKLQ